MIVRVEEMLSKKLSEIARYFDLDSSSTEVNVTGITSQAQSVTAGDLFLVSPAQILMAQNLQS